MPKRKTLVLNVDDHVGQPELSCISVGNVN